MKINPLLLCDFYKTTHHEQYPAGLTKIVSYYTPRMTRINGDNTLIMFGLQGFIKKYLIHNFNDNFFSRPKEEVLNEYKRVINYTLGFNKVNYEKIAKLHDLGYLPIEIKAVDEGTRVPVKVPMFEISNTHPDFAWLVNTLESALSCSLWHTQISANVGFRYRQIVNKYYELSVDDDIPRNRALGDFSMRGQDSCESAIKCSAGWCLSFVNTATVPAILYLENYYNCNCEYEPVAFGAISTEHSVMNSNYAVDGDESVMVKRLLNDIYPHNSFSMVSDSYDYWNMVDNILPDCRDEILKHGGYIGIRGDSGDPVEITTETVKRLWNSFDGSVNSKGFKVLNPHIKVIYGDSITPQRTESIYKILIESGFACNNVILASGSLSMQSYEQNGKTKPYTRDTFGIAIKATYCEINGKPVQIYKDPKTDTANFKKSQRGMCVVYRDENGNLDYKDSFDANTVNEFTGENLLAPVFRNGGMLKEQTLQGIRNLLHGGNF
ncbi:MAG: nicotinate phosphoribosyltransferase [Oscillospiraceae bacterium]|jgi:nicotinamide phosphoribosyltransferase|nr:nicotinate phosphoribosyltransferase [Oscillospiraceae bacterium]